MMPMTRGSRYVLNRVRGDSGRSLHTGTFLWGEQNAGLLAVTRASNGFLPLDSDSVEAAEWLLTPEEVPLLSLTGDL